jgi:hypothetical protein
MEMSMLDVLESTAFIDYRKRGYLLYLYVSSPSLSSRPAAVAAAVAAMVDEPRWHP